MKRMVLAVLLCSVSAATAAVKPAALFSDHMVLQRGVDVPVWGWAAPGENVTVKIAGQSQTASADAGGKWMVHLASLEAGGPLEMTINDQTIRDILVGEVWLASGQSNMEFTVSREAKSFAGVRNEAEEIAAANYPKIRMFTVPLRLSDQPLNDVEGKWEVCSPQTVGAFSAVGYFFARDLHRELSVPVGIVSSSFGASTAQSWISRDVLAADSKYKKLLDDYDAAVAEFDPNAAEEADAKAIAAFNEAVAKAKAEGGSPPRRPRLTHNPHRDQHNPSLLYNGQIHPIQPYAIRGAIWYQGESVVGGNDLYLPLMKTLIASWRQQWGQGDFPFIFVQLASYRAPATQPAQGRGFTPVREAQLQTLSVPNTAMVVTIDIGDASNVHPKNKQDVGARLALAARGMVYGEKIEFSGPIYDSMEIKDSAIQIHFKHASGGLAAKGGRLQGFAIAGADRKFEFADAKIEGDTVIVSSPAVPHPVAVRYGWAENPPVNLYNGAGLPASPFRTDSW